MNGAMADPWARIKRPPIITITIITGRSQSFLRMRRNAQNSGERSSYVSCSELARKAGPVGAGRIAIDPIAVAIICKSTMQHVATAQAHGCGDRRQKPEIDHAKYDRTDDPVEDDREAHPRHVEGVEHAGKSDGSQQKKTRRAQRDRKISSAFPSHPCADQRKDRG